MKTENTAYQAPQDLDADVQALQASFDEWIARDLTSAQESLRDLEHAVENGGDSRDSRERLFGTAHNMKGLGGGFGYPLVSDIAEGLCVLLKKAPQFDPFAVKVLVAHVNAIDTVIKSRIQGDGGDAGRSLLGKLETAAAKVLNTA